MGRKAASLKSKSSAAVVFPHDGPIHYYYSNGEYGGESITCNEVRVALNLLSPNDIDFSSDAPWKLARTLCQTLQSAENINTQLQALHSYRSTLLNSKQQQNSEVNCPEMTMSESLARGLYRLLLEWSLSVKTPLPLQRAIQSSLNTLELSEKQIISTSVLNYLWVNDSHWNDRLHSIHVAANFPCTSSILQTSCLDNCLCSLYHEWLGQTRQNDDAVVGLVIVKLLKILLQDQDRERLIPLCSEFEHMVLSLMKCPTMPTDGFNTLGIVYAKLHLCSQCRPQHSMDYQQSFSKAAILAVHDLQPENEPNLTSELSLLARLSIVQGIAAILDPETLIFSALSPNNVHTTPLEVCWKYSLEACQVSTDSLARWAALKGLSTLASRWKQQQEKTNSTSMQVHDTLIQETLDVVLQAWENPPLRKLGTAIPGIFETLVQLLPESQLHELCHTIMDQPLNRKGRYLALEILLPYFAKTQEDILLRADSLLEGVGDRGPNTGPIADLWIKLLGHTWNENSKNGETTGSASFEHWMMLWLPSLGRALLVGDLSRRRQVASFCMLRLFDYFKRTKELQNRLPECMELLLKHIENANLSGPIPGPHTTNESLDDRILWAQLELARQFHLQKVMTPLIQKVLSAYIPLSRLQTALTHELSSLRLVAFQSLEVVVIGAYGQGILDEAELWKTNILFSIKTTSNKEYTTNILQSLTNFLDRFSMWEAKDAVKMNVPHPKFYSFSVDFIIGELVLKQGAYPGTVADKEEFSLLLSESLLTLVLQDQSYTRENGVARKGVVFMRKRQPSEQTSMMALLEALLQQEVFASLFSLLHSSWDSTRSIAFRVISKFVVAAHTNSLSLPTTYCDESGLRHLNSRGLYLASSPRQRESDTGSRLLAFVCISKRTGEEQLEYMSALVEFLESRLTEMKLCLESILFGDLSQASALNNGKRLPLAHGIIRGILLMIQHQILLANTASSLDTAHDKKNRLYERLIHVFCEAIQLSLKVVADVRGSENLDGMEENHVDNDRAAATPLNVNTGAIGANGIFSKLRQPDEEEKESRLAMQRIVVGTWLLTKETCAAVSSIMAAKGFQPSPPLVQKCGALLISTLTSLKHAGAAFAARDSLEGITQMCLRSEDELLRKIPQGWVDRLLGEMCSAEKVRDSTLRRSTGYALGVLALMRSELMTRTARSSLCDHILRCLVAYSLPAERDLQVAMSTLNYVPDEENGFSGVFSFCNGSDGGVVLPDSEYESRCRVHALNVLRMIILDAPLASAVSPFIGDSIIASLLGYSDPSWAVRNSSTMVFSAAMLRVVDADKNASNTDRTSSQAITLTELFRRYPPLLKFLPAMMQHCLLDQDKHVHSQLFPILLLLSRTQPVALSGSSSISQAYPDIIFGGLANKDHSIRAAAARSLGNVCSDEINNPSSSSTSILKRCATSLMERDCDVAKNWNQVDGILLAMKAILSSSNTKETTLQDVGVHHLFLQIVRLESTPMYPPSCISTVLDLLVQHTEESKERRELIPVCLEIAKHCRFEALAGGALLYASAAKSLISLLEPDLWKPCDSGVFEESILYLQSLLASELIDVRLTAVKSFKKTIYQNIDGILAQENDIITADQVLSKIATVLLHCIEVELKHGKSSQKSLGPHIPTVRRLSRCFLECFDGYQQLKPETVNSFVDSIQTIDATLWSTAMAMVEHEKLLRDEELLSNGETFLSGNAVELMSIQIASDLARGILVDTRVHVFSNVVCRLNDSQASWRSRFSAVKAITTSQILAVYRDFCDGGAILSEVIEMLQDSDPDVRSCAARTAQQVLRSKCKPEGDDVAWSALPLPTLRRLYAMIHETASNDEGVVVAMAEKLLQSVQASSRDLISTMLALDEELEQTRTAVDLSQLTNSSAARTIFEAEDPNPFSERILKDQLAIQALLRLPSCQAWMASLPTAQALVEELTKVLVLLQKRINAGGIIHDMSRYPGVFPVLHGLLGVVAASIYLGFGQDETTNEIQRKATSILEEASTTMHPDILSMIKCLAHVETGSMAAKSDLKHCLFLL